MITLKNARPASPRLAKYTLRLMGVIALLSVIDLALMVVQLRNGGMYEVNPIARWMIELTGSSLGAAGLKLLTLGVALATLYPIRGYLLATIAAGVEASMLVGVMVYWGIYLGTIQPIETIRLEAHWVTTVPGAPPAELKAPYMPTEGVKLGRYPAEIAEAFMTGPPPNTP